MRRVVVWFSCGAASAVAAMLTLRVRPEAHLVYCDTGSEHLDNARFLRDCEKWLEKKVIVLRSKRYENIWDVFKQGKYLSGPKGALCTTEMKKVPRFEFQRADDIHVFGYTADEEDRYETFLRNNPDADIRVPLIAKRLRKNDCIAIINRAGIKIPEMYRLGYENNNCVGCVKGGAGYWNKIRKDFPYVFWNMADIEREIGFAVLKRDKKPIFLDELPKEMGNYGSEPRLRCSLLCESVIQEGA